MNPASIHRTRGFTLIEILVAVLIFALMSAAAYAAVDTLLRARQALHQRAQTLQQLQMAMNRFERDMRQAIAAPVRSQYGEIQPFLKGDATSVELTRTGLANPLGRTRARIERVQWALQDKTWNRLNFAVLDRAINSQPQIVPMLDGVTRIVLTYYDGTAWRTQWPRPDTATEAPAPLPAALALELETTEYGRLRRVILLVESSAPDAAPTP
jgi:general secretion pathway protein J